MSYFRKLELGNTIAAQEGDDTGKGQAKVSAVTANDFVHCSQLQADQQNLWDKVKAGQPQQIFSEVLGEFVWWCKDEAQATQLRRQSINVIPYAIDELKELVGKLPEDLRNIHALKKRFKGRLKQREAGNQVAPENDLKQVRCGDCKHFTRDAIGDGSGVGVCTVRAVRAPYPKSNRYCTQFQERPLLPSP